MSHSHFHACPLLKRQSFCSSFNQQLELRSRGITAIEFLLVLAALSILFISVIAGAAQRNERLLVDEAARNLQFSLAYARHEAISRRSDVRLCPTENQASCSGRSDWSQGWMVADMETGEVLRLIEPQPAEVSLIASEGLSHQVQFSMRGDAFGTSGDFVLCHSYQPDYSVALRVSAVGSVEYLDTVPSACTGET